MERNYNRSSNSIESPTSKRKLRIHGTTLSYTGRSLIPRFQQLNIQTNKNSQNENIITSVHGKRLRSKSFDERSLKVNHGNHREAGKKNMLRSESSLGLTTKNNINEVTEVKETINNSVPALSGPSRRISQRRSSSFSPNRNKITKKDSLTQQSTATKCELKESDLLIRQEKVNFNEPNKFEENVEDITEEKLNLDGTETGKHHEDANQLALTANETNNFLQCKLENFLRKYTEFFDNVIMDHTEILQYFSNQSLFKNEIPPNLETFRQKNNEFKHKLDEYKAEEMEVLQVFMSCWSNMYELLVDYKTDNEKLKSDINKCEFELQNCKEIKCITEKKLQDAEKQIFYLQKQMEEISTSLIKKKIDTETQFSKPALDINELKAKYARRLKEAEIKIKNYEVQIETLNANLKKMEDLLKMKGKSLEDYIVEKCNSEKFSGIMISKLENEKTALEKRNNELLELMKVKEHQYITYTSELEKKLRQAEERLADMEAKIADKEKQYSAVRQKLIDMKIEVQQNVKTKRELDYENVAGLLHSKLEFELWDELQSTSTALKIAEKKICRLHGEKQKFLQIIEQVIEEKGTFTYESWVAHIISKENEIQILKNKVEQISEVLIYSQDLLNKQNMKITDLQKTINNLLSIEPSADSSNDNKIQEYKTQLDQTYEQIKQLEHKLRIKEKILIEYQNTNSKLENLIKVKDEIVHVMKMKKDMTLKEHSDLLNSFKDA